MPSLMEPGFPNFCLVMFFWVKVFGKIKDRLLSSNFRHFTGTIVPNFSVFFLSFKRSGGLIKESVFVVFLKSYPTGFKMLVGECKVRFSSFS